MRILKRMVCLFAVVFFFCSCGELHEKRYEKNNLRIRELLDLGTEYKKKSYNDSAMICLSEAYELVNPMTDKEMLGDLYMDIGYLYVQGTTNDQAIKYFKKAVNIFCFDLHIIISRNYLQRKRMESVFYIAYLPDSESYRINKR